MHATYENDSGYQDNVPSPLLKWSAVFGGLVLGLAMLLLLSSLWLALAYGSEVDTIRDNLGWFMGASGEINCGRSRRPHRRKDARPLLRLAGR